MEAILKSYPVGFLKREIAKTNIENYSKLKKAEVIKLMLGSVHQFKHLKINPTFRKKFPVDKSRQAKDNADKINKAPKKGGSKPQPNNAPKTVPKPKPKEPKAEKIPIDQLVHKIIEAGGVLISMALDNEWKYLNDNETNQKSAKKKAYRDTFEAVKVIVKKYKIKSVAEWKDLDLKASGFPIKFELDKDEAPSAKQKEEPEKASPKKTLTLHKGAKIDGFFIGPIDGYLKGYPTPYNKKATKYFDTKEEAMKISEELGSRSGGITYEPNGKYTVRVGKKVVSGRPKEKSWVKQAYYNFDDY